MAVVDVGKAHSESISVSIFQSGSNRCDVMLKNALFGDTVQSDEYVVGVQSCQVPLDGSTFLSDTRENALLISIKRRRHAINFEENRTVLMPIIADDPDSDLADFGSGPNIRAYTTTIGDVRSDRVAIREFGDLIELLNQWVINFSATLRSQSLDATWFNQTWDAASGDLTDDDKRTTHLHVRITPSGVLAIEATRLFWNNFFLEFGAYAQEVFGFPQYLTFSDTGTILTGPGTINSFVDPDTNHMISYAALVPTEAHWKTVYAANGDRSIWGSLETRLSVSLGTSIPLQRSLVITDDKESRTFELGSWSLNNEVKTVFNIGGNQFGSAFTVETQSRSGHVVLKSSADPITEWLHLKPDTGLRNLRLRLYIRERIYAAGKWTIEMRELDVKPWATWNAKLLFVRKT